ncbi:MAG: substrate-binding domain-containing protein, partial [Acidimicrobiia bacterium]|nr:substrate-binding domain-containing protein [Acidimicrobiia bacterium]
MRLYQRCLVGLVLTGVVSAVTPVSPAVAEGPTITGGGSSFAALEIDQWRADVARRPFNLKINYQSLGSTFGRTQYLAGTLDFGASDIPFQRSDVVQGPRANFAYVPVSAGGIGFMYNLQDSSGRKVTDLKLTRRAVCRMFTEDVMKWNDPDIVAHNPRLAGVNRDIKPIVRQDGSGTSYVFSQYCIGVAKGVWDAFVRAQTLTNPGLPPEFKNGEPTSLWPGGGRRSAGLAADGVANAVADPVNGKDAITYNEAGFAKERGFPNASVQNASGRFTAPEEEAVTVALGYASPNRVGGNEDGTFALNYSGPDPRAYFPSTYSYVIAQTAGFPADKGQVLARFLCYAVTKGQEIAPRLEYARLSSVLVELALRQIAKIPGFPGEQNCAVAGAAPPPPPPELTDGGGGADGPDGAGGGGADGAGSGPGGESGAGGAGGDGVAGSEAGADDAACATTTTQPPATTGDPPSSSTSTTAVPDPTTPTTLATTEADACVAGENGEDGGGSGETALDTA